MPFSQYKRRVTFKLLRKNSFGIIIFLLMTAGYIAFSWKVGFSEFLTIAYGMFGFFIAFATIGVTISGLQRLHKSLNRQRIEMKSIYHLEIFDTLDPEKGEVIFSEKNAYITHRLIKINDFLFEEDLTYSSVHFVNLKKIEKVEFYFNKNTSFLKAYITHSTFGKSENLVINFNNINNSTRDIPNYIQNLPNSRQISNRELNAKIAKELDIEIPKGAEDI